MGYGVHEGLPGLLNALPYGLNLARLPFTLTQQDLSYGLPFSIKTTLLGLLGRPL